MKRIPYNLSNLSVTAWIPLALAALGTSGALAEDERCVGLSAEQVGLSDFEMISSEHVAGAPEADLPHCVIRARINERTGTDGKTYAIGFEMRLPDDWNGRFVHQANGGADGVIVPAFGSLLGGGNENALSRGYAVLSSDAGHDEAANPEMGLAGGSGFGLEPLARLDYGYRSTPVLREAAEAVMDAYYGRPQDYSYMVGCSNGGRHGLVAASRFPESYDGVLAGAPGFNLPLAALKGPVDIQAVQDHDLDLRTAFTRDEMNMVAGKILDACDGLDGIEDGIVGDLAACQANFVPSSLACDVGTDGNCLSSAQTDVLTRMMTGPVRSDGEEIYVPFPYDPGIASGNWRFWRLESPIGAWDNYPLTVTRGGPSLAMIFTTPPTQVGGTAQELIDYQAQFDLDVDTEKLYAVDDHFAEAPMDFMRPADADDPRMREFEESGGKMIVFHGNADGAFPVTDTMRWYDRLQENSGGEAENFVRFYPIPGMAHCSGGPSTDNISLFDDLVAWVEDGEAPQRPIGRVRADNPELPQDWSPDRTRPLCNWPEVARYDGQGDVDDADSFSCAP